MHKQQLSSLNHHHNKERLWFNNLNFSILKTITWGSEYTQVRLNYIFLNHV